MGTCLSTTAVTATSNSKIHVDEDATTTTSGAAVVDVSQKGGGSSSFSVEAAAAPATPTITQHPIMRQIEMLQLQSNKPFGRLLDAGTGLNSLRWIAHINESKSSNTESSLSSSFGLTDDWTAVTASPTMYNEISREAQRLGILNPQKHFVIGNWFNDDADPKELESATTADTNVSSTTNGNSLLLEGELYDTILIDYVIGAMDAFSPYKQDCFLERIIRNHLNPNGGRLYLIGTEPIPEKPPKPSTATEDDRHENKSLVCRANNMRDACIKLAGQRCYREYPLQWTLRNIRRLKDVLMAKKSSHDADGSTGCMELDVVHVSKYNLLHHYDDIHDQLGVARSMLKHIHDGHLVGSLEQSIDKLNIEAKQTFHMTRHHHNHNKNGRHPTPIHLGFDYLVVIESKIAS